HLLKSRNPSYTIANFFRLVITHLNLANAKITF
ncbi:MAG: hypothetical protein ACI843_001907, partial [Psychrobacter glaciei]